MKVKLQHYELFAKVLVYPGEDFLQDVEAVRNWLEVFHPEVALEFEAFYQIVISKNLDDAQAVYTRSFDVQAITTMDVAYVLFGDDYKRGEILSHLNREHLKAQNDCGSELADYLPNMLSLIASLEDEELRKELVEEILAPALRKMIQEFIPARLDQKNKLYQKHYKTLIEAPGHDVRTYQHVLKALYWVLRKDFSVKERNLENDEHCDFLQSVSAEMDIENGIKD